VTTHTTKNHFHLLDGMRGIAAITIILYHFALELHHNFLDNAPLAVDIFFMLSGFVIAYSYGENIKSGMSPFDFIGRRIIRLYPLYIVGILLGFIAFCWYWQPTGHVMNDLIKATVTNAFFLPYLSHGEIFASGTRAVSDVLKTNTPVYITDGPLWSVMFEMFASILFIMLAHCRVKTLFVVSYASLACLLVIAFVTNFYLEHMLGFSVSMGWGSANIWGGFPRVMYGFAMGMIMYNCLDYFKTTWLALWFSKLTFKAVFLYVCLLLVFAFPLRLRGIYYFFIIICVAPLVVYLGAITTITNTASLKIARFLGWISYPVYCLHPPIWILVISLCGKYHVTHNGFIFCIYISTVLLISITVTLWYEEPVRKYLGAKLRRQFT
jgi:peptidoglycan/LPS O-acetylase OafA/YrhL